jgi:hypothetical protein
LILHFSATFRAIGHSSFTWAEIAGLKDISLRSIWKVFAWFTMLFPLPEIHKVVFPEYILEARALQLEMGIVMEEACCFFYPYRFAARKLNFEDKNGYLCTMVRALFLNQEHTRTSRLLHDRATLNRVYTFTVIRSPKGKLSIYPSS